MNSKAQISLEPRCCPVCGTGEHGRAFAEANVDLDRLDAFAFASRKLPEYMHWALRECARCDVVYADPAPSPATLSTLYREAAFDSGDEARHASRTYARFLPEIIAQIPDRAGALDIGTGDGAFLRELVAAGFTRVQGIEPSTAPIEAADPAIRPLIVHDLFRPDLVPARSFSLITCFQTIEHLPDPLAFCRDAAKALKPGGALFLIGHNRRALSARLMGFKSPIYDIEHLQLFSPASLHNLLARASLTRITVRPLFNRYPLQYWTRLVPIPRVLKTGALAALHQSGLGRWLIPLPAGNLAAIAYRQS